MLSELLPKNIDRCLLDGYLNVTATTQIAKDKDTIANSFFIFLSVMWVSSILNPDELIERQKRSL